MGNLLSGIATEEAQYYRNAIKQFKSIETNFEVVVEGEVEVLMLAKKAQDWLSDQGYRLLPARKQSLLHVSRGTQGGSFEILEGGR